ncbi:Transporter, MFS superfamily [Granulibacter bethesdensis]|nr:Transporter, MFS superfamily [Granulibacter bethesdensis]
MRFMEARQADCIHSDCPHSRVQSPPSVTSDIPARLDRLPWSRFHTLVIIALGITWILDGLEVTLAGSLAGAIASSPALTLTGGQAGLTASAYLAGAVGGALFFGWLTDRLGRKKLFTLTVLLYLTATILSGLSWSFWSFVLFRFLTGAGIGGEYAAVNATIQELIPARSRGFVDLTINGSFWLGAAIGALGSVLALGHPEWIDQETGWRASFVIGGLIGFIVLLLRRWIPESPRWLMTHGRPGEADEAMHQIETMVAKDRPDNALPPIPPTRLRLRTDVKSWFLPSLHSLFTQYRDRTILAAVLMGAQAFCYNALLFTYALVLNKFEGVSNAQVGFYIFPFALGNFLGPLLLGRWFDTLGRKTMITGTYLLSGLLMTLVGLLFGAGMLDATAQTVAWTIVFFFASAAASSAYLTVGENFPLEVRAVAIAIFYALGTGIGGIAGPALFGHLIDAGRNAVMWGYAAGGALMMAAGLVELRLGVDAENKSLEEIALPLSSLPLLESR